MNKNIINLPTLTINKMTQEQYNSLETINPNEIYLTPEEEIDLSGYATREELQIIATNKQDKINSPSDIGAASTSVATTSAAGLMSANDKSKLDNIATGASKIVTGTYVGTGTYGADNPNSLTFDFIPKLIIITLEQIDAAENFSSSAMEKMDLYLRSLLFWHQGLNQATIATFNSSYDPELYRYYNLTNKTFSWYTKGGGSNFSNSASYQFNSSGTIYYYTAIG